MTRIAVLADVHGNLPALEAVLDDLARAAVDEVLVGGDLVGRGPEGSAVAQRIRSAGLPSVRGNHEDYLLDFRRGNVPTQWQESPAWSCSRWMAAELTAEDARYLAGLPDDLVARSVPGLRVVHGSPRSNREGVGPWTDEETLAEIADLVGEPVLACAHTHRPLQRRARGTLLVNVGSVGLPFNGDPRAQYAVFELGRDGWRIEPRCVPYDREPTLAAYHRTGFLEAGGLTARLLELELRTARSYLVPFEAWVEQVRTERTETALQDFLERYDPVRGLAYFLAREVGGVTPA